MLIDAPPTLLNTIYNTQETLKSFRGKGYEWVGSWEPFDLILYFCCAKIHLCYYVVQPCCYAVQICCSVALKPYSIPARCEGLGTKANSISRWPQVCFSCHSFVNFHGTYGNQTENNVNIFLIVKLFDWTSLSTSCLKTTCLW